MIFNSVIIILKRIKINIKLKITCKLLIEALSDPNLREKKKTGNKIMKAHKTCKHLRMRYEY